VTALVVASPQGWQVSVPGWPVWREGCMDWGVRGSGVVVVMLVGVVVGGDGGGGVWC
jgi:hypothetical protein